MSTKKPVTPVADSTAVAVPETLSQAEQDELNEFLGVSGKDGKEHISPNDIIMPRVALLQDLSPQVKDRNNEARGGEFYNIITDYNYGDTVEIIALLFYTSRIKWDSPTPGANIECIARDGENGTKYGKCADCRFKEFSTDAQGKSQQPACTEFKNLICLPLEEGKSLYETAPASFSGKRSALNVIRQLLTRMHAMRYNNKEVPMYMHRWQISSVEEKNDQGTYYMPVFKDLGMITDIQALRYLKQQYQVMKESAARFVIPEEHPGEESASRPNASEVIDADFKPKAESDY
jgi:hypothetical protein